MSYCVFCEIIERREPANIVYEDEEVIVFRNLLHWAPVMLLSVPKKHMTQHEMWRNMNAVGRAAVEMGEKHCPHGFRLISNFGYDAMQSQIHAHVHVVGGMPLSPYA